MLSDGRRWLGPHSATRDSMMVELPDPVLGEAEPYLSVWSEPLVRDCLIEHYGALLPDAIGDAYRLADAHTGLWVAIVSGEDPPAAEMAAIDALCRGAGLSTIDIAAANVEVMLELLAIVQARFRRAPRVIRMFESAFGTAMELVTSAQSRYSLA